MLPLGIMIGLAVRMGYAISFDPHRAKLMAAYSTIFITAVGFLVTSLLYIFRLSIILLFTKDNEVVQGCLKIWPDVCWYIFLLYIFGISSAVYRGLGMQWRLAVIVTTSLYIFLLPTVIYFAVIKGGGLYMQWRLLPVFYTMMQVVLILGYVLVDWDAHSETIRIGLQRSILEAKGIHHTNGSSNVQNGNNDSEPVETTPLL
jgi:Na+-driven multidrug efflux pump